MTFSTGLVDVVSYLGLGRVFTANMTGNIVLLGFGIAGSGDCLSSRRSCRSGPSSPTQPSAAYWR
jgi:uncharacterized membrane protein YoaK (UPF0700 family)